jgi:hypothetical protein
MWAISTLLSEKQGSISNILANYEIETLLLNVLQNEMNPELIILALISLEQTFSKGDTQTTERFEMN